MESDESTIFGDKFSVMLVWKRTWDYWALIKCVGVTLLFSIVWALLAVHTHIPVIFYFAGSFFVGGSLATWSLGRWPCVYYDLVENKNYKGDNYVESN